MCLIHTKIQVWKHQHKWIEGKEYAANYRMIPLLQKIGMVSHCWIKITPNCIHISPEKYYCMLRAISFWHVLMTQLALIIQVRWLLSSPHPFNHKEADTGVFSHVNYISLQGYSKIIIRVVDTDVLRLAVSVFSRLKDQLEEWWGDFGVGKHRKYVPVYIIFNNLGESRASGLSIFYAFAGCDHVPFLVHVTMGLA